MTKLSLREEIKKDLEGFTTHFADDGEGEDYNCEFDDLEFADELLDKILSIVKKQVLESLPKDIETVFDKRIFGQSRDWANGYNQVLKQVKQNIHKIFKGGEL